VSIFTKGIDRIIDAATEQVEWSFGDIVREGVEGIGTSDINCCIHSILESLNIDKAEVSDNEWHLMRNFVHNKISDLDGPNR
jgi:hypothetical protein